MIKRLLCLMLLGGLLTAPAQGQIFRKNIIHVGGGTGDPLNGDGGSSFFADGSAIFDGKVLFADGTVGAPGIGFRDDPDSGLYRIGANNIGLTLNGVKQVDYAVGTVIFAQDNFDLSSATATIDATAGSLVLASSGAGTVRITSGDVFRIDGGSLTVNDTGNVFAFFGQDNTNNANINIFGNSTTTGARVRMYNSADEDAVVDFYEWEANDTVLQLEDAVGGVQFEFSYDGDFNLKGATDPTISVTTAGQDLVLTTASGDVRIDGEGTGQAVIGDPGFGGNFTGISLNGALSTTAYTFAQDPADQLFINTLAGKDIAFRVNNVDVMRLKFDGKLGILTNIPLGQAHIDQTSTSGAVPVLVLDQGDIDDSFVDFIGTSAADGSRSLSSGTGITASKVGSIRVEINGVTRWLRFYDTAI